MTFCLIIEIRKKIILNIALLLGCFVVYCQDSIHVNGRLLNNSRFDKMVIKKFNIGSFNIAAVAIKNDGSFSINAPKNIEPGVYRFQYSQTSADEYIDVILNGNENEVSFTLDINEAKETRKPIFTKSNENINWYQYQKEREVMLQKIQAMQQLVALYPVKTDPIVQQVQDAIKQEINNCYDKETLFLKQNTTTWAGKMVANKPYYFTNPKDHWRLQAYEIKEHYWDNITTNNPELINTPLYTEHILAYLKYYMNPEMHFSETEMEEGLKESVDKIIQKFSGSDATKKFAIQYLQIGFKEIGNEKVLQYIDEKYKETIEQCQDESDKAAFDKRVQGYATIKVGNKAPDITFTTLDFNLHAIAAERIIVVFWASWCPHCMQEIPKLNEWAIANPTTKVVAISLDDDKTAYETAIQKFPSFIHDCDFKKWDGKAVNDYYVYGTPTLVLLDKDKKIVNKFSSFEQLETFLKKK